jgi:hypothetical protein
MILSLFGVTAFADGDEGAETEPVQTEGADGESGGGSGSGGGEDGSTNTPTKITVPLSGSAYIYGDTENNITEIPVYKTVTVTPGVSLPHETFYIQMAPATDLTAENNIVTTEDEDGKKHEYTVASGLKLKNEVLPFEFLSTDDTSDGEVVMKENFSLELAEGEEYKTGGIYRYYITEVVKDGDSYTAIPTQSADEQHYIEYDSAKYIVDLYVAPNSEKEYVVTNVTVTKVGRDAKPTAISFVNKINCAKITIQKIVKGDQYVANEAFKFYMLIPVKGDSITLDFNGTITGQVYNSDGSKSGDPIDLKVNGDDIDVDVATYGTYFELMNGQYLEITAPVSMIYKVQEADYTGEGYVTSATYEEGGNYKKSTTLTKESSELVTTDTIEVKGDTEDAASTTKTVVTVRGTTNTSLNRVIYTNTRELVPESGINLDFLPYVLVLVGALAIGGAWFFFRKRRTVR